MDINMSVTQRSSGGKTKLTVHSHRSLIISNIVTELKVDIGSNNRISRIYDDYGLEIKVGDVISIGSEKYKVNFIEEIVNTQIALSAKSKKTVTYHLSTVLLNDSYTFMAPMLFHFASYIGFSKCYVSSFLGDDYKHFFNPDERKLISMLRPHEFEDYSKVRDYLTSNQNFIESYVFDSHHVCFVHSIPERWHASYDMILDGKYSRIDPVLKDLTLQFHNMRNNSTLSLILNRDAKYREELEKQLGLPPKTISEEAELYKAFDLEECILKESYKITT